MVLASAYRQLRPAEKAFVDSYVSRVEREAQRSGERISNALYRPVPDDVVADARGLLDRPMVTAAITERINQLAQDSELSVARIVKELMGIGFSSVMDYMTVGEDGMPYFDLARATPEQLAAVQSVEFEESYGRMGPTRKFKFKLHDKLAAIDKLAKFMGMLEADNPHWRASQARPIEQTQLPTSTDIAGAGDAYSRMING